MSRFAVLLSLCVALATGNSAALQAQATSVTPPLPPPGRLIDLGGWRVHLNCTGAARAAQPTILLEAGIGDFSVDWSLVQPGVARFARVCSYDRAGSGWSDLGPRPRTMHQIVSDLHTLLGKSGERAPYVLVGHSYGGALVRVYQSLHPADVVGMVLVDAVSDNPLRLAAGGKEVRSAELATGKPIPPVKTSDPLRESDIPERIVKLIEAQTGNLSVHANDPPRNKLPADAQRMRTWTLAQVKHSASNDNPVDAEEFAELRIARTGTQHVLGGLPLIVLARGMAEDGPREPEHTSEQATLATLSRTGKLVVATRSGHHVPIDEPELVVAAIREVIAAARP